MRIGYIVDIHGAYERVPEALAGIGDIDLLVIGGDITTGGTPDEAERAIADWRAPAPVMYALAGNMDSPEINQRLADIGIALDARGRGRRRVRRLGRARLAAADALRARRR